MAVRRVIGPVHRVNDGTGAEEQQCLEEGVSDEMNIPDTYAPTPTPTNMYPSCEIVEYANTF